MVFSCSQAALPPIPQIALFTKKCKEIDLPGKSGHEALALLQIAESTRLQVLRGMSDERQHYQDGKNASKKG